MGPPASLTIVQSRLASLSVTFAATLTAPSSSQNKPSALPIPHRYIRYYDKCEREHKITNKGMAAENPKE